MSDRAILILVVTLFIAYMVGMIVLIFKLTDWSEIIDRYGWRNAPSDVKAKYALFLIIGVTILICLLFRMPLG